MGRATFFERTNMSNVILPYGMVPGGLTRRPAAAHLGVCPSTYSKLEAAGIAPKPMNIPVVTHRQDRLEIYRAIDELPRADLERCEDGEVPHHVVMPFIAAEGSMMLRVGIVRSPPFFILSTISITGGSKRAKA
jgi:hypothetical protein